MLSCDIKKSGEGGGDADTVQPESMTVHIPKQERQSHKVSLKPAKGKSVGLTQEGPTLIKYCHIPASLDLQLPTIFNTAGGGSCTLSEEVFEPTCVNCRVGSYASFPVLSLCPKKILM